MISVLIIVLIVVLVLAVLTAPVWGLILLTVRRRRERAWLDAQTVPEHLRGGNRHIADQLCPGCGKVLVRELAVCPSCWADLEG